MVIKDIKNVSHFINDLYPHSKVEELKNRIEERTGMSNGTYRLVSGIRELINGKTLTDLQVANGATITMHIRVHGGSH